MEDYFYSFLTPTLHRRCFFFLSRPSNLPVETEPPGPSKYEATFAHIGEGLGLFVVDVWIAAYDRRTFFRNVRILSPVHIPEEGIFSNPAVETSSPDR
jgi:hypothetical protein